MSEPNNLEWLDEILDIPNILRMASEKGSDITKPDQHIQLRIVFYNGKTETYPITLSYDLIKLAITAKISEMLISELENLVDTADDDNIMDFGSRGTRQYIYIEDIQEYIAELRKRKDEVLDGKQ